MASNYSGQVYNGNTLTGRISFWAGSASGGGTLVYNTGHMPLFSADAQKWNGSSGNTSACYVNWTRRQRIRTRLYFYSLPTANATYRVLWGRTSLGTAGVAALANRGIGFEVRGSGALWLSTHNGTARTDTNTGIQLAQYAVYEIQAESDGKGNATLLLDGAIVASSTGAPISLPTDATQQMIVIEITTTDSAQTGVVMDRYLWFSRV